MKDFSTTYIICLMPTLITHQLVLINTLLGLDKRTHNQKLLDLLQEYCCQVIWESQNKIKYNLNKSKVKKKRNQLKLWGLKVNLRWLS